MEYNLGFLTFLSAVILYVAYQQWKTTKKKFNLDCYDRRIKVYEEVRKFIELVNQNGSPTSDEIRNFDSATHEAEFLFGSEISQYISTISRHGLELMSTKHSEKIDEQYKDDRIPKIIKINSEWFREQINGAKMEFKKYLDISG
ncbi:hypothetical protein B0F88_10519 [Methylobacter tundripaludum]|uniref:DUF4760 domain-containing protein n=1 Tax=Methylobacter tundripaludum TaxID=173365 RepID=A0A2S6H398_9GAMM|nr:hypothetical protein [Methylobacter tundripaludum]PPK71907.1 hypothetical protein B0F88_10519 [Methylobacter tundripaludum]